MGSLLKLQNVSYSAQNKAIINDLSLILAKGEVAGLMGSVGAGKTTLAHLICNLLKPDSGTIELSGMDIRNMPGGTLFKNISMVFQFPEKQIFQETVYEEICFGLNNLGFDKDYIESQIIKYLNFFGLGEGILKRPPLFLSGGEMRKVALISALAVEPKVLILDEPFSWLDEDGCSQLKHSISHLRSKGSSFILISHDVTDFHQVCSKLWLLEDGNIAFERSENNCAHFKQPDKVLSIG